MGWTGIALALLLGGCEARFTADLATDAPADPGIAAVQVNLLGLEFRKDDGNSTTMEFRSGELVDLLDLQDLDPLRLFTDEQLPAGQYTGVRLLFDSDEDDNVVTAGTADFPLLLAEGNFAEVDFKVEDEERSEETLTLMLDLRQSLTFDDADDEYTLTPRLRAVATGDAARIEGNVTAICPLGTSLLTGGAVYLFSGEDVEPDDLDGVDAEPFATTRVVDRGAGVLQYALRFVPAGTYTLALTCNGDDDELGVDDEVDFLDERNVELDAGELQQQNFQ
jgi:hypothetical protein